MKRRVSSGPQMVPKVPWCVCVSVALSLSVCLCQSVCVCTCSKKGRTRKCKSSVGMGHSQCLPLLFFQPLSDILSLFPASLLPQSQRKKAVDTLPSHPNLDKLINGTFGLKPLRIYFLLRESRCPLSHGS